MSPESIELVVIAALLFGIGSVMKIACDKLDRIIELLEKRPR